MIVSQDTNSSTRGGRCASMHYAAVDPALLPGSCAASMPTVVRPQLAILSARPPEGDKWLHEIKFDGYRTVTRIDNGNVRLLTRNGYDWTGYYGRFVSVFRDLPCRQAIMDGEVAVQDATGCQISPLWNGRSRSAGLRT